MASQHRRASPGSLPIPAPKTVACLTSPTPAAGIGLQTAKALLQQDYYVVLGCRSQERAEAARAQLR
jgi:NADP-dependent 3-hydroxy acid dehydrogenase YdfG